MENEEFDLVEGVDEEGNSQLLRVNRYFYYNGEEYVLLSDDTDRVNPNLDEVTFYVMKVTEGVDEEGEEIETEWEDISHAFSGGTPVTLLRVRLITGKTHQIRAHLSAKGYPVIGDPKYGGHLAGFSHQLLHAYELYLPDGRVFRAPVPRKFRNLFIDFHETGVSG